MQKEVLDNIRDAKGLTQWERASRRTTNIVGYRAPAKAVPFLWEDTWWLQENHPFQGSLQDHTDRNKARRPQGLAQQYMRSSWIRNPEQ